MELKGCIWNTSNHARCGEVKAHIMTACLSEQIRMQMGCMGMKLPMSFVFFSFVYKGITYPCTVIRWFDKVGEEPDDLTRMWIVHPATLPNNTPNYVIIHIDSIYHAAHLIPIYCTHPIPLKIKPHHSYDAFNTFYVNKYADHHSFAIAS